MTAVRRRFEAALDRRSAARVAEFRDVEGRAIAHLLPDASEQQVLWSGGFLRAIAAGDGPPIVFLHGVTGTLSNFASLAGTLVSHHRCVLVDLPGHGLSGPIDLARSRPRPMLVEAIGEAIRQTGDGRRALLVGNSLGGMAALYLAVDRPELVAVLGEPAFAFPGANAKFPLRLLGVPIVGRLVMGTPPPPLAMYRRTVQRAFGTNALEQMGPDALDANRRATRAGGHASSVAELMRSLMSPDGSARDDVPLRPHDCEAIVQPVWFLWGTDDPFMSFDAARPWMERIPHATSDVVAGAHVPWFDAPDLARQRIEALVESAR